jgi:hypothetical protein
MIERFEIKNEAHRAEDKVKLISKAIESVFLRSVK